MATRDRERDEQRPDEHRREHGHSERSGRDEPIHDANNRPGPSGQVAKPSTTHSSAFAAADRRRA